MSKREREREREREKKRGKEIEREKIERVVVNTVGAKVPSAMNTATPWAPQLKAATPR